MMLVNIRHPQVMARLLSRHDCNINEYETFSYGVYSALIAWLDSAPQDEYVQAYCQHHPALLDPGLMQVWDRYIKEPAGQATRDFPDVQKQKRIGELFRC